MSRLRWLVVPALVLAFCAPADGAADARKSDRRAFGASVKTAVSQVEEGDRITLTARIMSPQKARRVTLLKRQVSLYFGTATWEPVKSAKVRGRAEVAFRVVATDPNTDRYRVSVTYAGRRAAVVSKPISLTVWRWIPLGGYDPYYSTSGVGDGQVDINGQRYDGWGPYWYSHAGSWEQRFTPGRHCKAFRGVLGLSDISDDGSSGTISYTADDRAIYSSPTLTPGMDLQIEVPLATPYRFGIQVIDTSPDELQSWPVIGDPVLLCTGV